jgi:DNA helicase-2/ATP-dependent DNA helicase PcrA
MVACFAVLFGYYGEGRGQVYGNAGADLANYVDAGIMDLGRRYSGSHPLAAALRGFVADVTGLQEGETLDLRPADYFYRLLALEPFAGLVKNENHARNLALFSQLLNAFQNYYHSFLQLLYAGGMNEYEDPDQPFPKGHVQVMTIHQGKGLEFPVVVVGSLDKQLSTTRYIDRDLQPYYQRPPFEPDSRITAFDRMRLHYVAFSRPEKVLVLTSYTRPREHFAQIWRACRSGRMSSRISWRPSALRYKIASP